MCGWVMGVLSDAEFSVNYVSCSIHFCFKFPDDKFKSHKFPTHILMDQFVGTYTMCGCKVIQWCIKTIGGSTLTFLESKCLIIFEVI